MKKQASTVPPSEARVSRTRGRLTRQKPPFTLKQIGAIRVRQRIEHRIRDLALFHLAIGSELCCCDLTRLRARDFFRAQRAISRAAVLQRKMGRPLRFEVTEQTREAQRAWIGERNLSPCATFDINCSGTPNRKVKAPSEQRWMRYPKPLSERRWFDARETGRQRTLTASRSDLRLNAR